MAQFLASAVLKGPGKTLGENAHPQYNDAGASASATSLGELKNRLVLFNSKLVRGVAVAEIDRMLGEIIALLRVAPSDTVPSDMFVKLMILTAYQRDIKDGKGERDIFYHVVFRLWTDFRAPVEVLLRAIIGSPLASYKDVLLMLEKLIVADATASQKALANLLFSIMLDALKADKARLDAGEKPATLVFKWAPRQQTHFDKKPLKLASKFAHALFPHEADHQAMMAKYRHMLSDGSRALETVEYLMCSEKWTEIDPAKVPAKAMKTYRKAFMNVDKKGKQRSGDARRKELATKLVAFLASGKSVHGATLMPHEIIQHLRHGPDPVLEAQLKNMVDEFVAAFSSDIGLVLPLSDVSGSMDSPAGSGKATCMDVSIALGFLLSQLPGPFHDKIMTFHADPRIYDLSPGQTLYDKIRIIQGMSWGSNTDFGKAMDYILRSLIDNKADPTTVPDLTLIVFSDMQFDAASGTAQTYYGRKTSQPDWNVAHERIEAMYKDTGFPTPRIVYWNLNARDSAGHPAHAETKGVAMLSGFSQAALKTFLAGELVPEIAEPATVDSTGSGESVGFQRRKDPYEVLCTTFEKYVWLMKKFEESGVFPGFVAPVPLEEEVASVAPVEAGVPAKADAKDSAPASSAGLPAEDAGKPAVVATTVSIPALVVAHVDPTLASGEHDEWDRMDSS